jgi:hypothetical protein
MWYVVCRHGAEQATYPTDPVGPGNQGQLAAGAHVRVCNPSAARIECASHIRSVTFQVQRQLVPPPPYVTVVWWYGVTEYVTVAS